MRAHIQAIRRALCPAVLLSIALPAAAQNQPDAGMLRYPDVSDEHIVFVYGNDLWLAPKDGGEASPVASPPGSELFPKFSPDGASVVFQGNYRGDRDLYTLPIAGGVPERITHAPMNEMPTDWHEARGVVFHARGMHGIGRAQNIFTVPAGGGMFTKLPMPYGANGALSPDGDWIAYSPIERDFRTWKRYRGGMAADIWLFNVDTYESKQITDWEGTDTMPMWHGDTVYYLSDAGPEAKLNIWAYNTKSDKSRAGHRVRRLRRQVSLDRAREERPGRDHLPARRRADRARPAPQPDPRRRGPHPRGPPRDPPADAIDAGETVFSPAASRARASGPSPRRGATSGPPRPRRARSGRSPGPPAPPSAARRGAPTGGGSRTSPTGTASTSCTSPSPTARARRVSSPTATRRISSTPRGRPTRRPSP